MVHPGPGRSGHIVVIGGSAGGIESLRRLLRGVPSDLAACVCVVLHLGPSRHSLLPEIVSRWGGMPASGGREGMRLRDGRIIISPPGVHLLVGTDTVHLDRGPRISGQRPAVDALFRSAALVHGPKVIGVVLSGTLDDGAAGLVAIERYGGTALVQDPADAPFEDMPRNAMEAVRHYETGSAEALGKRIAELVAEPPAAAPERIAPDPPSVLVMTEEMVTESGASADVQPTGLTCPECHGALWPQGGDEAGLRCRVGHVWSAETMAAAKDAEIEASLWAGLRALQEKLDLSQRLLEKAQARGDEAGVARFAERAAAAARQAHILREFLTTAELPAPGMDPADQNE